MLRAEALDQTRSTGNSSDQSSSADFQQCVRDAKANRNTGAQNAPAQGGDDQTVTVKRGDTLWGLAKKDGVSLHKLLSANPEFDPAKADGVLSFNRSRNGQWDPDYIRPGDRIRLPVTPHDARRPHKQSGRAQGGNAPNGTGGRGGVPRKHATAPRSGITPKPTPRSSTPTPLPRTTPTPPSVTSPSVPPHGATPAPTLPNPISPTPTSPNPTSPSPTLPPSGAPHATHGPQTFIPIPIGKLIPSKGGFGIENGWKFSKTPTVSGEPYGKASWDVYKGAGTQLNLNVKLKYTPRAKATIGMFDPGAAQNVAKPKPSLKERVKSLLPEKVTLDAGLVLNKQVEGGGSIEWRYDPETKKIKVSHSAYISKKDPTNVLVDNAQLKVGKLKPKELVNAITKGTRDSIKQPSAEAKANGRWAPLGKEVWNTVNGAEVTVAGEKAFVDPHGPFSGFGNFAGKTTLKDIGKGLEPPAVTPSRAANLSGFATGTIVSYFGAQATDELVGKNISNSTLRKAVDGFGAGMSGVVADAVTTKAAPILASKITASAPWTKLAQPALEKAGSLVSKAAAPLSKVGSALKAAAPDLGKAGEFLSKIAPDLTKAAPAFRILGKVGRIGGPAGAVIAGIPDGIDAVKEFEQGKTTEGLKSVGRAAVRVGFTAAGAALGTLIPIPGVGTALGAVAGGFVGDLVAGLF